MAMNRLLLSLFVFLSFPLTYVVRQDYEINEHTPEVKARLKTQLWEGFSKFEQETPATLKYQ